MQEQRKPVAEVIAETKVEPGVVQVPAPRPQDEAARSTVKERREMTMPMPVKGGGTKEFAYIREDM